MSRVTKTGMDAGQEGRSGARSDEPEARSEVRCGARRKEGVVVRLLRVSRWICWPARAGSAPGGSPVGVRSSWLVAARG
jgi:hypothetical protein